MYLSLISDSIKIVNTYAERSRNLFKPSCKKIIFSVWKPLCSGGNLYSLFPFNLKKLEKAQFGLRDTLPCFMCKTVSLSHYPK